MPNGIAADTTFALSEMTVAVRRAEVQTGLTLDPKFTIRRFRAGTYSNNPVFLKQRESTIEGMRKAGVPER